jgi:hypothetical protein
VLQSEPTLIPHLMFNPRTSSRDHTFRSPGALAGLFDERRKRSARMLTVRLPRSLPLGAVRSHQKMCEPQLSGLTLSTELSVRFIQQIGNGRH